MTMTNTLSALVQTGINFKGVKSEKEMLDRFFEYLKDEDLIDSLRWMLARDDTEYASELNDPSDFYNGIQGIKDYTETELKERLEGWVYFGDDGVDIREVIILLERVRK